jgi:hypothetical protein
VIVLHKFLEFVSSGICFLESARVSLRVEEAMLTILFMARLSSARMKSQTNHVVGLDGRLAYK